MQYPKGKGLGLPSSVLRVLIPYSAELICQQKMLLQASNRCRCSMTLQLGTTARILQ